MRLVSVVISLVLLTIAQMLFGQTNLYNKKTQLTISEKAQLYISGDYQDDSDGTQRYILLNGKLMLGGDFINNSENKLLNADQKNDAKDYGSLIMTGGNVSIDGDHGSLYVPSLTLSGSVNLTLGDSLEVQSYIDLAGGSINLGGNKVSYMEYPSGDTIVISDAIINESINHTFNGTGVLTFPSYFDSDDDLVVDEDNFKGTGLGFELDGRSSVAEIIIKRVYSSQTEFNLTDDSIHSKRYYTIQVPLDSEEEDIITIPELRFNYYQDEVENIDTPLAIYVRDTTDVEAWVRLETTGTITDSLIRVEDFSFVPDQELELVLAKKDCDEVPDAIPTTSQSDVLDGTTISICDASELTLSSDEHFVRWIYQGDTTYSSSLTINNTNLSDSANNGDLETIKLFERSRNGCQYEVTYTLDLIPYPTAIIKRPGTICDGDNVLFEGDSSLLGEPGRTLTYTWDFEGIIKSGANVYHTFSGPKSEDTVHLTVQNEYGCPSSTSWMGPINMLPYVSFELEDTVCQGSPLIITNNSYGTNVQFPTPSTSGLVYAWQFESGGSSSIRTPTYTYNTEGVKSVYLQVTDARNCVNDTTELIDIKPLPTASFEMLLDGGSFDPTGIGVCEGIEITLNNESTEPRNGPLTYLWDFGDSESDTQTDLNHSYTPDISTTYNITLTTTTEFGCVDDSIQSVLIHPAPEGDQLFMFDPDGFPVWDACIDEQIQFQSNAFIQSGTIDSVSWNFGDSQSSNDVIAYHSYASSGNYNIVQELWSDHGCRNDILTDSIFYVDDNPLASFQFDATCDGDTVNFYGYEDPDKEYLFDWTFRAGETSELQNPSHVFPTDNQYSYDVLLTVVDSIAGCTDHTTSTVTIKRATNIDLPSYVVSMTGSYELDPVESGSYPNVSTGTFYWVYKNDTVSTSSNFLAEESGSYEFHIYTDDGCYDSQTINVFIVAPQDFPAEKSDCDNVVMDATVNHYPTTNGTLTYKWYHDGAPFANEARIEATMSGEYVSEVVFRYSGADYIHRDTIQVSVDSPPILDLGGDKSICEGETAILQSNVFGGNTIWTWYNSKQEIVGTDSVFHASLADTYRLVVRRDSCESSITVKVSTFPAPESGFTVSKREVCEGEEVSFQSQVNAAQGDHIVDYLWDFGDGTSSSLQNPDKSFTNHGIYTVTFTVTSSSGCSDSYSSDVTVYPNPTVDFDFASSCEDQSIGLVNNTVIAGGGTLKYTWDFGDSTGSTLFNPDKTYSQPGTYVITLSVEGPNECILSESQSITIHPKPTGSFHFENEDNDIITGACENELIYFINNTIDPNSGVLDYSWDFGDGQSSILPNPTYSYANSGSYSVILTVTTEEGCEYTLENTIHVRPVPEVAFDFSPVCDGNVISFINNTTLDAGAFIKSYYWDFGDGNTSKEQSPDHTYNTYGSYNITLTVETTKGCAASLTKSVEIYRKPEFDLDEYVLSVSGSYLIDPAADPLSYIPAGSIFRWSDKDGEVSTNPTLEVSEYGVYHLTIESPEGCDSSASITVYNLIPNELGGDLTVCGEYLLDATVLDAPPGSDISYSWFKDGASLDITEPELVVTETADYRVDVVFTVLTETGHPSKSYSDDITINVQEPSDPIDLGGTIDLCRGSTVMLTSNVVADSYVWKNLTTNTTLGSASTQLVSESGLYQLETSSGTCNSTGTVEVVDASTPIAGFTADNEVCINSTVTFQSISFSDDLDNAIIAYAWDFGDGSTSTLENPDKSYASSGNFSVILTVTSENGCTDAFTKTIRVDDIPSPVFSASDVCFGDVVSFVDASINASNADYTWDFGDGHYSSEKNPSHLYEAADIYSVSLTLNNACEATYTDNIAVLSSDPIFNSEDVFTCGSSMILGAGVGNSNYRWYDVGSNTTLATTQSYTENTDRLLGLSYTSANGCPVVEEVTVHLNSTVQADLGLDRTVCESVILNPGAFPGATFLWSTGATSPTIEIINSGTYSVDITDQNGCTTSDAVVITVETAPTLEFGPDQSLCFGEELILDAGNSGATYLWSNGATSQTIFVNQSGEYAVLVEQGSCSVSDTIYVTITDELSNDFEVDGVCSGAATIFNYTGSESNLEYLWDFGDGTTSVQTSPQKIFTSSGIQNVSLTITDANGCSATITKPVDITPGIIPDFTFSNACEGAEMEFLQSSSYTGLDNLSFQWYFSDGQSASGSSVGHVFNSVDTYVVRLEVTNDFGCSASISKAVNILESPEVSIANVETCESSTILDAENLGSTYLWSDNSIQQTLEVTTSGSYAVMVTDANGCFATDSVEVIIFEYEQPDLGADIEACGTLELNPSAVAASYEWSTGQTSSIIDVQTSGTYWVKTRSADLCPATDTIVVTINELPEFELGDPLEFCEGESVVLNPSSSIDIDSYSWSDGSTGETLEVAESGNYSVVLTSIDGCEYTDDIEVYVNELPEPPLVETYAACERIELFANNAGSSYVWSTGETSSSIEITSSGDYWVQINSVDGCSLIDSTSVTITTTPIVDLGFDQVICSGSQITLDAENAGAVYRWSTGATTKTIEIAETGEYAVEVSYGGCSLSDTIRVTVLDELDIDFEFTEACSGAATVFTYTGTESNISYSWNFGDGTSSVNASPSKIFSTSGSFEVLLTITNQRGCSVSTSKTVVVSPRIQPNFAFGTACEGNSISFTNASIYAGTDSLSYLWYFGDGTTSTEYEPAHTYFSSGTFLVRLEVSNESSCLEYITKNVEVRDAPYLDLGDYLESCSESIVINAGSYGEAYRWSDNSSDQTLEVFESGTYWVRVTGENGCVSIDSVEVEIYEYDRPDLGEDLELCGEFILDPNAHASSFEWSTGDDSPTITINETGTYWVQTVSDDFCFSRDTIDMIVNPLPEFDLGEDIDLCEGEEVTLIPNSTEEAIAYLWSTGETTSQVTINTTGSYSATLTTSEGCEYTDEIDVTINELPESVLEDYYLGCASLRLEVDSPDNAILWSTGEIRPYLDITTTGTYWIEIRTRAGCSIIDSTFVEIVDFPNPDLGPDVELCYGEEVTLDAGVFTSYKWNGIEGGRFLDVGVSGIYEVEVTNEYGCVQTDEVEVIIRPSLGLDLPDEHLVCEGSEFTLDAGVAGEDYTYEWKSPDGRTGTERLFDSKVPGLYYVTVSDPFGCSETDAMNVVTTTESIEASFLVPSVVTLGDRVNFIQLTEPEPVWFEWDLGNGVVTDAMFNMAYRYQAVGPYTVSLTVSNGICEHKVSKEIEVVEARTTDQGDEKVDFVAFENLKVYPNPASDYINLLYELTTEATVDIQVYDLSGFLVAHHALDNKEVELKMDISTYASGTYIVIMRAGADIKKMRFIKMK